MNPNTPDPEDQLKWPAIADPDVESTADLEARAEEQASHLGQIAESSKILNPDYTQTTFDAPPSLDEGPRATW